MTLQLLIEKRISEIKANISKAQKDISSGPKGSIYISKNKGTDQFYYWLNHRKHYISKKNTDLIHSFSQAKYACQYLQEATEELNLLEQLLYKLENCKKIFSAFPPSLQKYISSYELDNDEFLRQWKSQEYIGKEVDVAPEDAIITELGETVRSKSEKIIADKLHFMNIDYFYEKPLYLQSIGTIYPDFTILDITTRREYYWEHFGMMDNPTYCTGAIKKIESYIKSNIYPGEQLIMTFETSDHPINTRIVNMQIEKYFF